MQAVILAGGKGTRLAERLGGLPKPLVDVCGIPLLRRQIETLRSAGVDRVVLLVNHEADKIRHYCAQTWNFGVDIAIVDDGKPRGTAGALLACLDELEDQFLVVYGDTLFDIDIRQMLRAHEAAGSDATLLLHPNDHPADSDLVSTGQDGWISAFHPYPHPPDAILPNLVNAAFYICRRAALAPWRNFAVPADLAKDLFPAMLAAGWHLMGYRSFEYIKDIGTPYRLDKAEAHLRAGRPARARLDVRQPCVFVDRDGTLNFLRGHIARAQYLDLLPGAASAVRRLNDAEFRVVVVTNQPVLARGECTVEELTRIHWKLETLLGQQGAFVDGIWWCPHHPDAGFAGEVMELKRICDCRKPEPGLIFQAADQLHCDMAQSWLIGDTTSDMLAARRAGLGAILVETGEGGKDGKYVCPPDFTVANVAAAVHLIIEEFPRWSAAVDAIAATLLPGEVVFLDSRDRAESRSLAASLALTLRRRRAHAEAVQSQWDDRKDEPIFVTNDPTVARLYEVAGRPIRRIFLGDDVIGLTS